MHLLCISKYFFYCMEKQNELKTLQDIKSMMQRSSRFISLSGLSGIAAGCCALIGAAIAYPIVSGRAARGDYYTLSELRSLFWIGVGTLFAAIIFAILFTYLKSKKNQIPIWGSTSRRMLWSLFIPLMTGGVVLVRLVSLSHFGLVAPGCLIFYGIALFSARQQTLDEIKYLGYAEIILGVIALWNLGYGLYFWTVGFGVFHIIYGIWMWHKYERR